MKRLTYVAVAALVVLLPIPVLGAGDFTDVDDSNVFKADIEWLADAGVTLGCNPPANDRFCPEAVVTRQQMAAFMHRLAANEVVNAATALDADTLDGFDSATFLQELEQAADADLLDGLDSSYFAVAADTYTKDEINASPEAWLKAGGNVDSTGNLVGHIVNWGGAITSRTSTGVYEVVLEGLGPGCGYDFPLPILTARGGIAAMPGMTLACGTGDATIKVEMRDNAGALADLGFTFLVYSNSGPDIGRELVGEFGYTMCEYDLDTGERVCA